MYEFYDGDDDPRLHESDIQSLDDAEMFGAVECENGCGFWRGGRLDNGRCPECGGDTNDVQEDHFED